MQSTSTFLWSDVGLTLLPGLVIAVVTAWTTVRLSLRKFASERLWERRLQAYEDILVALHDLKRYAEAYIESYERQRDFSDVESRVIGPQREAQATLSRVIDTGGLYIAKDAVDLLRTLQQDLRRAMEGHDFFTIASAEIKVLENGLQSLHKISRTDIGKSAR